jgi:hypothetical protein
MKKLLLLAILLFGTTMFAQDTFIKKYTWYATKEDGVLQPDKELFVTVVFNEKNTNNIVLHYEDGNYIKYVAYGDVEKVVTNNGYNSQVIKALDDEGKQVLIQLFDDSSTLRIILGEGWYIEFHQ